MKERAAHPVRCARSSIAPASSSAGDGPAPSSFVLMESRSRFADLSGTYSRHHRPDAQRTALRARAGRHRRTNRDPGDARACRVTPSRRRGESSPTPSMRLVTGRKSGSRETRLKLPCRKRAHGENQRSDGKSRRPPHHQHRRDRRRSEDSRTKVASYSPAGFDTRQGARPYQPG